MDKIDELLTRGVDKIYPSKDALEKVLRSGKKLRLYQGFDPTDDKLHIGHMVGLMKMRQWQKLGHHVIFLIGDFTAMVGDPTGKYSARKVLSHEETLENAKDYKNQASKILDFEGKNPAEVLYNGDWLGKVSAIDFFRISGNLTYAQVVERDMFQERIKQGQDVYANEFLYPVMQAYDSVAMNVDLELGGRDQMFNMMMGRKLMRNMLKKEKFVMTTVLLEDSEGKKIGKSEGNAIALNDDAKDLFGKIMSFPDEVITQCFECLTNVPMEEIHNMRKSENPMNNKKKLAFEIVAQLNDNKAAQNAQEYFEKIVQKQELPEDMPIYQYIGSRDTNIVDLLMLTGLVSSKSEARRLVEQGGVEIDGQKQRTENLELRIKDGMIIRAGKRKFVKLSMSS